MLFVGQLAMSHSFRSTASHGKKPVKFQIMPSKRLPLVQYSDDDSAESASEGQQNKDKFLTRNNVSQGSSFQHVVERVSARQPERAHAANSHSISEYRDMELSSESHRKTWHAREESDKRSPDNKALEYAAGWLNSSKYSQLDKNATKYAVDSSRPSDKCSAERTIMSSVEKLPAAKIKHDKIMDEKNRDMNKEMRHKSLQHRNEEHRMQPEKREKDSGWSEQKDSFVKSTESHVYRRRSPVEKMSREEKPERQLREQVDVRHRRTESQLKVCHAEKQYTHLSKCDKQSHSSDYIKDTEKKRSHKDEPLVRHSESLSKHHYGSFSSSSGRYDAGSSDCREAADEKIRHRAVDYLLESRNDRPRDNALQLDNRVTKTSSDKKFVSQMRPVAEGKHDSGRVVKGHCKPEMQLSSSELLSKDIIKVREMEPKDAASNKVCGTSTSSADSSSSTAFKSVESTSKASDVQSKARQPMKLMKDDMQLAAKSDQKNIPCSASGRSASGKTSEYQPVSVTGCGKEVSRKKRQRRSSSDYVNDSSSSSSSSSGTSSSSSSNSSGTSSSRSSSSSGDSSNGSDDSTTSSSSSSTASSSPNSKKRSKSKKISHGTERLPKNVEWVEVTKKSETLRSKNTERAAVLVKDEKSLLVVSDQLSVTEFKQTAKRVAKNVAKNDDAQGCPPSQIKRYDIFGETEETNSLFGTNRLLTEKAFNMQNVSNTSSVTISNQASEDRSVRGLSKSGVSGLTQPSKCQKSCTKVSEKTKPASDLVDCDGLADSNGKQNHKTGDGLIIPDVYSPSAPTGWDSDEKSKNAPGWSSDSDTENLVKPALSQPASLSVKGDVMELPGFEASRNTFASFDCITDEGLSKENKEGNHIAVCGQEIVTEECVSYPTSLAPVVCSQKLDPDEAPKMREESVEGAEFGAACMTSSTRNSDRLGTVDSVDNPYYNSKIRDETGDVVFVNESDWQSSQMVNNVQAKSKQSVGQSLESGSKEIRMSRSHERDISKSHKRSSRSRSRERDYDRKRHGSRRDYVSLDSSCCQHNKAEHRSVRRSKSGDDEQRKQLRHMDKLDDAKESSKGKRRMSRRRSSSSSDIMIVEICDSNSSSSSSDQHDKNDSLVLADNLHNVIDLDSIPLPVLPDNIPLPARPDSIPLPLTSPVQTSTGSARLQVEIEQSDPDVAEDNHVSSGTMFYVKDTDGSIQDADCIVSVDMDLDNSDDCLHGVETDLNTPSGSNGDTHEILGENQADMGNTQVKAYQDLLVSHCQVSSASSEPANAGNSGLVTGQPDTACAVSPKSVTVSNHMTDVQMKTVQSQVADVSSTTSESPLLTDEPSLLPPSSASATGRIVLSLASSKKADSESHVNSSLWKRKLAINLLKPMKISLTASQNSGEVDAETVNTSGALAITEVTASATEHDSCIEGALKVKISSSSVNTQKNDSTLSDIPLRTENDAGANILQGDISGHDVKRVHSSKLDFSDGSMSQLCASSNSAVTTQCISAIDEKQQLHDERVSMQLLTSVDKYQQKEQSLVESANECAAKPSFDSSKTVHQRLPHEADLLALPMNNKNTSKSETAVRQKASSPLSMDMKDDKKSRSDADSHIRLEDSVLKQRQEPSMLTKCNDNPKHDTPKAGNSTLDSYQQHSSRHRRSRSASRSSRDARDLRTSKVTESNPRDRRNSQERHNRSPHVGKRKRSSSLRRHSRSRADQSPNSPSPSSHRKNECVSRNKPRDDSHYSSKRRRSGSSSRRLDYPEKGQRSSSRSRRSRSSSRKLDTRSRPDESKQTDSVSRRSGDGQGQTAVTDTSKRSLSGQLSRGKIGETSLPNTRKKQTSSEPTNLSSGDQKSNLRIVYEQTTQSIQNRTDSSCQSAMKSGSRRFSDSRRSESKSPARTSLKCNRDSSGSYGSESEVIHRVSGSSLHGTVDHRQETRHDVVEHRACGGQDLTSRGRVNPLHKSDMRTCKEGRDHALTPPEKLVKTLTDEARKPVPSENRNTYTNKPATTSSNKDLPVEVRNKAKTSSSNETKAVETVRSEKNVDSWQTKKLRSCISPQRAGDMLPPGKQNIGATPIRKEMSSLQSNDLQEPRIGSSSRMRLETVSDRKPSPSDERRRSSSGDRRVQVRENRKLCAEQSVPSYSAYPGQHRRSCSRDRRMPGFDERPCGRDDYKITLSRSQSYSRRSSSYDSRSPSREYIRDQKLSDERHAKRPSFDDSRDYSREAYRRDEQMLDKGRSIMSPEDRYRRVRSPQYVGRLKSPFRSDCSGRVKSPQRRFSPSYGDRSPDFTNRTKSSARNFAIVHGEQTPDYINSYTDKTPDFHGRVKSPVRPYAQSRGRSPEVLYSSKSPTRRCSREGRSSYATELINSPVRRGSPSRGGKSPNLNCRLKSPIGRCSRSHGDRSPDLNFRGRSPFKRRSGSGGNRSSGYDSNERSTVKHRSRSRGARSPDVSYRVKSPVRRRSRSRRDRSPDLSGRGKSPWGRHSRSRGDRSPDPSYRAKSPLRRRSLSRGDRSPEPSRRARSPRRHHSRSRGDRSPDHSGRRKSPLRRCSRSRGGRSPDLSSRERSAVRRRSHSRGNVSPDCSGRIQSPLRRRSPRGDRSPDRNIRLSSPTMLQSPPNVRETSHTYGCLEVSPSMSITSLPEQDIVVNEALDKNGDGHFSVRGAEAHISFAPEIIPAPSVQSHAACVAVYPEFTSPNMPNQDTYVPPVPYASFPLVANPTGYQGIAPSVGSSNSWYQSSAASVNPHTIPAAHIGAIPPQTPNTFSNTWNEPYNSSLIMMTGSTPVQTAAFNPIAQHPPSSFVYPPANQFMTSSLGQPMPVVANQEMNASCWSTHPVPNVGSTYLPAQSTYCPPSELSRDLRTQLPVKAAEKSYGRMNSISVVGNSSSAELSRKRAQSPQWTPLPDNYRDKFRSTHDSRASRKSSSDTNIGAKDSLVSQTTNSALIKDSSNDEGVKTRTSYPAPDSGARVADKLIEDEDPCCCCLWEAVPEVQEDAEWTAISTTAAMEDHSLKNKTKKRRHDSQAEDVTAAGATATRRRSSRLRSQEETKKIEDDKLPPNEDTESHVPCNEGDEIEFRVVNGQLKSDIKSEQVESCDAYLSNVEGGDGSKFVSTEGLPSGSSTGDLNNLLLKPEKVKSRWRRWSELESDNTVPPPPPPAQNEVITEECVTDVKKTEDVIDSEEKRPYFEDIVDNIFLSSRFFSLLKFI
jgi:hypothetical protein